MIKKLLAIVAAIVLTFSAKADLVDGSFESLDAYGYSFFQGGIDTPWQTTAQDNLIEGWSTGFLGVPAYHGTKFVELNANYASTLYQDVNGLGDFQPINWHFAHRGRNGIDTMRLTITDLGWDQVWGGGNDTVLYMGDFVANNTNWETHYGTITSIGNLTRFSFEAISAEGGNTQGNFIDWCGFGPGVVIPGPGSIAIFGLLLSFKNKNKRRS